MSLALVFGHLLLETVSPGPELGDVTAVLRGTLLHQLLLTLYDHVVILKKQEQHQDVVRVSYTRGKTGKPVKQFLFIFE